MIGRFGVMFARRAVTTVTMVALLTTASCSKDDSSKSDGRDRNAATTPAANVTKSAGKPSSPWFEDIALSSGLVFHHRSGHDERHLFPEIMGGGAALFDMDNDGDLDAYLVQSGSLVKNNNTPTAQDIDAGNQLFRNNGNGRFKNVTPNSGAADTGYGYGMGVAAGDYDNDGDVDLYVTNVGPNVMLRNDGDGRFADVTDVTQTGDPSWSTSAAFVDIDADGDLDLFVTNYVNWSVETELDCYKNTGVRDYCSPINYNAPAPDRLYVNNGDGTFTDISDDAGLRAAFGNGLGVVCADFNNDGRQDIFVANDGMENQYWVNLGDNRFEDQSLIAGCALDHDGKAKAGMGVDAADIDDDSDIDLLVVNLRQESDSYYRNEGDFFTDQTAAVGLGMATRQLTRFGIGLIDFDNDGWLDLFIATGRVGKPSAPAGDDPFAEPNLLLRGSPGGRFAPIATGGITKNEIIATSRAAAFGDIDNDGGVDILIVNRDGPANLLRNIVANRGHGLRIRVLDENNRDAIGAIVTVFRGERTISRVVKAAYSYCASNDPQVYVGTGVTSRVDKISVRWIDGKTDDFGPFSTEKRVVLRRNGNKTVPN
jgi:enediyne biosynthesis protein E4